MFGWVGTLEAHRLIRRGVDSGRTAKKRHTPRESAVKVLEFINSGAIPDFLSNTVQVTVDHACDHVGYARLMHEPGFEKDDLHLLTNLCRRTRMLYITEMEKSSAALARHIVAILKHPECPAALFEAVAEFVTETQNYHPYGHPSLANQWHTDPALIEQVIERANEYENAPDDQKHREVETG